MSSTVNTPFFPEASTRSVTLFFLVSFIVHIALVALAYKVGIAASGETDSMPARIIHVQIQEPQQKPLKPVVPVIKKVQKKILKKRITTQAPSLRAVAQQSKKPVRKSTPEPVFNKPYAPAPTSPIPSPVINRSVLTTPQPTYQPKPKYPTVARRRGTEGIVILEISLSNNGNVSNAFIIKGSGSSALDRSALKAVKTWRFPASQFNGLSSFKQKIEFRLNHY